MTAAPIAILSDMTSASAISTLASALGLPNAVFCVSGREALDRLFEPFEPARPWPGRLVSFFSDVVVPRPYLDAMSLTPVNIHPGPPEYPGKRALEFARRDGVARYGVTAHVMTLPVDSGAILAVLRFPLADGMSADAMRYVTSKAGFALMLQVLPALASDLPLDLDTTETWGARDCSEAAWRAVCAEQGKAP